MQLRLPFARLAAVVLLAVAGPAGCATAPPADAHGSDDGDAPTAIGVGDVMPDLAVAKLRGKGKIRLRDLRGKVVLLDIWASWCAPCKEEMPVLDQLAIKLAERGVEIIAVSIDEQRAEAEAFVQGRKQWSLRLAHDPAGALPDQLKPPKMPTSYIFDRQGILRHVQAGYHPSDAGKIEARLESLTREATN
jgi:cytochrome c biogenesis protein CcmG, thiol:disulfide interchange protein DsbE